MIQEIAEEELTWIRDHGCQATTTDLERDAAQEDLLNLALEAEKDKEKDIHNTQWAKKSEKSAKIQHPKIAKINAAFLLPISFFDEKIQQNASKIAIFYTNENTKLLLFKQFFNFVLLYFFFPNDL